MKLTLPVICAALLLSLAPVTAYSARNEAPLPNLGSIKRGPLKDTLKANAYIQSYTAYYVTCSDSFKVGRPYLLEAYNIYLKAKNYNGLCDAAYFLANDAQLLEKYGKALEYAFISLKYAETINNKTKIARAYRILGLIYFPQQRWKEAMEYFEKSMALLGPNSPSKTQSTAVYLTGLCKVELGACKEAMVLLDRGLKIAQDNHDTQRIYECYWAKGRAMRCLGKYAEAANNLELAAGFFKSKEEYNALSSIYSEFAQIEMDQKNYAKALVSAKLAQEYDEKSAFKFYHISITKLLYEIYNALGQKDMALEYLKQYNDVRDSIMSHDVLSDVAVAQAKYEFRKVEDRINAELKENEAKKKRANILTLLFGAFIVLGSFAFYSVRKARKKSDELLLNILPKNTAEELKKFGKAKPKTHPSVTILFCDVESFTKVSEQLSAETLVNMLNFYFGGFDRIMGKYKVEKIKTIGDAYMCVCGLNGEQDHAFSVVSAALEMQEFLQSNAAYVEEQFGLSLKFRIGVNSGTVVSGVVGSKKYAYDIWGDAVNTAARMEQTSEPGKINISEYTHALVGEKFKTTYRGEIPAKNKADMKMYFIDGFVS